MRVSYFLLAFILILKASFLSPYSAFAMSLEDDGGHHSTQVKPSSPPLPGSVPDPSPHPVTASHAQSFPTGSVAAARPTLDSAQPLSASSATYRVPAPAPLLVLPTGAPIGAAGTTPSQGDLSSAHSNPSLSPLAQPIGAPLSASGSHGSAGAQPSPLANQFQGSPVQAAARSEPSVSHHSAAQRSAVDDSRPSPYRLRKIADECSWYCLFCTCWCGCSCDEEDEERRHSPTRVAPRNG
jgi:hypothetical protein